LAQTTGEVARDQQWLETKRVSVGHIPTIACRKSRARPPTAATRYAIDPAVVRAVAVNVTPLGFNVDGLFRSLDFGTSVNLQGMMRDVGKRIDDLALATRRGGLEPWLKKSSGREAGSAAASALGGEIEADGDAEEIFEIGEIFHLLGL
jgi:hypothetical protein